MSGGGSTGGNVALGSATLTIAGTNATPVTYGGAISGTGGVVMSGSGVQTFSGLNNYSGGTSITGGTLYANTAAAVGSGNSSTGSGSIAVSSGGTLAGSGLIAPTGTNGISVAAGGHLTPGGVQTTVPFTGKPNTTANGSLTLDTTNLTPGSTLLSVAPSINLTTPQLTFALGAGDANSGSQIIVSGGVANVINFNAGGGGGSVVAINDLVGAQLTLDQKYVLIQGNNTTFEVGGLVLQAGNSDGLVASDGQILGGLSLLEPGTAGNFFSQWYGSSELFLVGDNIEVEVIPEPSTWALIFSGVACLFFWQRRKNGRSR